MALHLSVDPVRPQDGSLVLAAEVIQAGGIVVYPTETLYGIGANAWNPKAVKRVQEIKKREEPKPILVLVQSIEEAAGLSQEILPGARAFMDAFWPGPLTLVLKAANGLPEELTRGRGTIGVRIPSSTVSLRLLALCGCPITSTSANVSGAPAPGTIEKIERDLGPGIDLFLDAGVIPVRKPSTVLDVSGTRPRLLREGEIPYSQLLTISPTIDR